MLLPAIEARAQAPEESCSSPAEHEEIPHEFNTLGLAPAFLEPPLGEFPKSPLVSEHVSEILREPRFRYCQEQGYQLWPHEKQTYCEHAEQLAARCPELLHACKRPAFGVQEEEPTQFDFDWSWVQQFGPILRLSFWLLLAVAVIFLIRALAKNFAAEMKGRKKREEEAPVFDQDVALQPQAPKETDVDRLLAHARAEAEQGRFASATASAYAAALRALEQRKLLELHRSRTNGDYLRQLHVHPEPRARLSAIVREVESTQFGGKPCDAGRFERILKDALALAERATSWALLVGVTHCLTACTSGFAPDAPRADQGPDGYALLEAVLQRHSSSAQRRVRRVEGSLDGVTTFVALAPHLRDEEWRLLLEWVDEGGTLLTAGIPGPLANLLDYVPSKTPCQENLKAQGLALTQAGASTFRDFLPQASRLVSCGNAPFLVAMNHGEGRLYALADDVWLRNANLSAADNAQVIVHLASDPYGNVELLGPWTGSGTYHPLESIHNAGLTPWLLHLLLLALAYAVARGVRFQSPLEPERKQRRAFVEHAEALAEKYALCKASGHALEQYGRWALDRIRERVPTRERDLHATAHAVARRTGGDPMAILRILVEAQSAGQIPGDLSEHLRTSEALSRILRDIGGSPKG